MPSERQTAAETAIDGLLIDVWTDYFSVFHGDDRLDPDKEEWLGGLFRVAYAQGYYAALEESKAERGSLCRELGYRVPPQRR